jgi:hypothetical protein
MDPTYRKIQELLNATQLLAEELEIVYDILDNLFEEEDYDLSAPVLLEKKKWIQKAIKKEGSLRKTLKANKGKNIPASKLKKAAEKGGKTGKRARLALTLRKLNEETEGMEGSWTTFIGMVGDAKRKYASSLPKGTREIPGDVMKALNAFTNDPSEAGDNTLDDLIQAGWDPEIMGKAAKIRRSAIASVKKSLGSVDPSYGGKYKPSGDPDASPFE